MLEPDSWRIVAKIKREHSLNCAHKAARSPWCLILDFTRVDRLSFVPQAVLPKNLSLGKELKDGDKPLCENLGRTFQTSHTRTSTILLGKTVEIRSVVNTHMTRRARSDPLVTGVLLFQDLA